MREYLVTWRIDVWAANPVEAAMRALVIQRDQESTAVVFEVLDSKHPRVLHRVDLGLDPS